MNLAGGEIRARRIGAEPFTAVFLSDAPVRRTPCPTISAIAEWLGEPHNSESISTAITGSEALTHLARHHVSGDVGLSPIGILVLIYELNPPPPTSIQMRAIEMVLDWLGQRAENTNRLTKAFPRR